MGKIFKIALTGGPCAGKSSAAKYLNVELEKLCVKTFVLPEVATSLMNSGITPQSVGSYEFHSRLFEIQYNNEKNIYEEACKSGAETAVIICDRGLLDNRAFVSAEEFSRYSARFGLNEDIIRCSYDGVFHLVTAADGVSEFYDLSNNPVRSESAEEAKRLDTEILAVYTGAPHLRIIDNSTDFEHKLSQLLDEVKATIGIPEPLEIERKFLIEYPDLELLNSIKTCRRVPITQAYLNTPEEGLFRIRKRGEGSGAVYIKTIKRKINELKRVEIEEYISEDQFNEYLSRKECIDGVISKDRYCIALNSTYYELDVYPFFRDRATLEVELLSENQPYVLPDFVKLIREVSFEKEYKNKYLAVVYGNRV